MYFQDVLILETNSPSFYAVLYLKGWKLGVCPPRDRQWIRLSERRDETVFVLKALGSHEKARPVRSILSRAFWWCLQRSPFLPTALLKHPAFDGKPQSFLTQQGRRSQGALQMYYYTRYVADSPAGGKPVTLLKEPSSGWCIMSTSWFYFDIPFKWEAGLGEKRQDRFSSIERYHLTNSNRTILLHTYSLIQAFNFPLQWWWCWGSWTLTEKRKRIGIKASRAWSREGSWLAWGQTCSSDINREAMTFTEFFPHNNDLHKTLSS